LVCTATRNLRAEIRPKTLKSLKALVSAQPPKLLPSAQIAKIAEDVWRDPKNGNGVIACIKHVHKQACLCFCHWQAARDQPYYTTYGGSAGNVEAAQQVAASKLATAAAGQGGAKSSGSMAYIWFSLQSHPPSIQEDRAEGTATPNCQPENISHNPK